MFDFIPVVLDQMVLASMSDLYSYHGEDGWFLLRPFRKETWFGILIFTFLLITLMIVLSMKIRCVNMVPKGFSLKLKKCVYVTLSFFFLIILAYYEGALIMFFSSETAWDFDTIKDVMKLYPHRKLMVREGYDIHYQQYVNSGDNDYVEFWDRVKNNPEETVFTTVDEVFERFPEGNMVLHELDGAIDYYLTRCGGKTKEHFDVYVKDKLEYHNLIVTKNSPLGPILRYGSRIILERGLLADFKSTWNEISVDCSSLMKRPSPSMAMQFRHVAYLFLSIAFVLFACLFILFGEWLLKKKMLFFPQLTTTHSDQNLDLRPSSNIGPPNKEWHLPSPALINLQILTLFGEPDKELKDNGMNSFEIDNKEMQIIVKTFTCEIFLLNVKPSDTIQCTKCKIGAKSGIPSYLQRLLFAGNVLQNEKTLCESAVPHGSLIDCMLEVNGARNI